MSIQNSSPSPSVTTAGDNIDLQGTQDSQAQSNVSSVSSGQRPSGWGVLGTVARLTKSTVLAVVDFVVDDITPKNLKKDSVTLPSQSNLKTLVEQVGDAAASSEAFENPGAKPNEKDHQVESPPVKVPKLTTDGSASGSTSQSRNIVDDSDSNDEFLDGLLDLETLAVVENIVNSEEQELVVEVDTPPANLDTSSTNVEEKKKEKLEDGSATAVITGETPELPPTAVALQPGRIKIPETLIRRPQQSETESKQEAAVEVLIESDKQKLENLRNSFIATLELIKTTPLNFDNLDLAQLEKVNHAAQWVLNGLQGLAVFPPLVTPPPPLPDDTQRVNLADQRKQKEEAQKLKRQKTLEKLQSAPDAGKQVAISQDALGKVQLRKTSTSSFGSPEPTNSSEKTSDLVALKPVIPSTLEVSDTGEVSKEKIAQPSSPSILEVSVTPASVKAKFEQKSKEPSNDNQKAKTKKKKTP